MIDETMNPITHPILFVESQMCSCEEQTKELFDALMTLNRAVTKCLNAKICLCKNERSAEKSICSMYKLAACLYEYAENRLDLDEETQNNDRKWADTMNPEDLISTIELTNYEVRTVRPQSNEKRARNHNFEQSIHNVEVDDAENHDYEQTISTIKVDTDDVELNSSIILTENFENIENITDEKSMVPLPHELKYSNKGNDEVFDVKGINCTISLPRSKSTPNKSMKKIRNHRPSARNPWYLYPAWVEKDGVYTAPILKAGRVMKMNDCKNMVITRLPDGKQIEHPVNFTIWDPTTEDKPDMFDFKGNRLRNRFLRPTELGLECCYVCRAKRCSFYSSYWSTRMRHENKMTDGVKHFDERETS